MYRNVTDIYMPITERYSTSGSHSDPKKKKLCIINDSMIASSIKREDFDLVSPLGFRETLVLLLMLGVITEDVTI
jgi:hypothetical protein